jgi:hypothetical protein
MRAAFVVLDDSERVFGDGETVAPHVARHLAPMQGLKAQNLVYGAFGGTEVPPSRVLDHMRCYETRGSDRDHSGAGANGFMLIIGIESQG